MTDYPLKLEKGYLYMKVGHDWYLIDTGTVSSFSLRGEVTIDGHRFELPTREIRGLDAEALSAHVGVEAQGLLGNDVLDHFDHLWQLAEGQVTVGAPGSLASEGTQVPLGRVHLDPLGLPAGLVHVDATVGTTTHTMIFDTGAAISYFDDPSREQFPLAGDYTDFYPNVGQFTTDTRWVPVNLGGVPLRLRCGSLKPLWGDRMHMGIVGNEILAGRAVGYFPMRGSMVIGAAATS